VLRYLSNLNTSKATGANGIPAKLLRMAAPGIVKSLTKLVNYSLKTGQIPKDWKVAHVTPVPKKGDKEWAESYRPVSILTLVDFRRLLLSTGVATMNSLAQLRFEIPRNREQSK